MKIAIAQISVEQSEFDKNLRKMDSFCQKAAAQNADLAVFPEMCVSGFNYKKNAEALASGRNFEEELSKIARGRKIAVAASLPALDKGERLPANRLLLVDKEGLALAKYDKIHLFSAFNENSHVCFGKNIALCQTKEAKFALTICYDIRFPEMFAPIFESGAEIILHVAAWPHPRMEQLKILSRARAIENQCYLVCVNQAGTECFGANSVKYGGSSAIINPLGVPVCECAADVEDFQIAEIDLSLVEKARGRMPIKKDRRPESYKSLKIFKNE